MIFTLLLSLVPICAGTLLATYTGGGTVAGILDGIALAGTVLPFVAALFISGYGRQFIAVFSAKSPLRSDWQSLKKLDAALGFAAKILFYTALVIPLLILICTLRNYYGTSEADSHLGPNCAVLLVSILYLSLFEMILCTLKAKVRKSVILYMAEEPKPTEPTNRASAAKTLAGAAIFLAAVALCSYVSGVYAWRKVPVFESLFDMPFIIILAVYVLPLAAISGNAKILFESVKMIFTGGALTVSRKNLCKNALKTAAALNWHAAFSGAACGWISMLYNLEDAAMLAPNIAVSLIPFFYAVCLNLILLCAEIRAEHSSE